jgi:hypothetical protein
MPNQNLTKQTNLVEINISPLDQIYDSLHEEGQTIVHCRYVSKTKYINGGWVNIHPTTFLVREDETLPLLHAENIPMAPGMHMFKRPGEIKHFTLIFPAIPKEWAAFSFIEECSSGGGFVVRNLTRNDSGVYNIFLQ